MHIFPPSLISCLPLRGGIYGGMGLAHVWLPHLHTQLEYASRTSSRIHQGAIGSIEIFVESCSHNRGDILQFPRSCVE
jgi:hypothetical protein